MPKKLLLRKFDDFKDTIELLEESLTHYKPYSQKSEYTSEEKRDYDAFAFRFQKAVEAGVSFFRTLEDALAAEKSEFTRNLLLTMEKLKVINNAQDWVSARELRNRIVHAYDPESLESMFKEVDRLSNIFIVDIQGCSRFLEKQGYV